MDDRAAVRIWAEDVVIPTYLVGEPNQNPMFLDKRVYQGSSGRVYPYPVIDKLSDERIDEQHQVVFLENEYLKLMVMPGFGGRIQYAYDKTNNYPFIYHNHVIKPALVGLTGPWLSGGIEFNWPQHHRPGTYCPVDYTITQNEDGSSTLWLSELEPMWHLKGTLGMTLYPGKALLEINIRLFNPTPLSQSFHLWTNPAVHVNDSYQSVFPPDVQAVYDHGKRDVSAFPIARGEYYKVDYSRGVDISWYKNLPVPTSYMAAKSNYDFLGGYDHGKQAGLLHVADHHFVPGKKQWVWGCGDFGRAWDRNLTDEDGPYAELMCGVFADNQPDFSWLQPYEEKEVKQFFLPYKAIGYVRNATTDAAVSLDVEEDKARLGAYATSRRENAILHLRYQGKCIWEKTFTLAPESPFIGEAALPKEGKPEEFELSVYSASGKLLVSYQPEPKQAEAIPEPAAEIPEPRKVDSTESLYLAGLHLEQYRHATREPEDYYREALLRDADDLRNNNALGLLLLRRGQFAKAEEFFARAICTATRHNPNPKDGEPHYNLGVCLRYLGRDQEAYHAFCKAAWDAGCQSKAFFQLAQLCATRNDWVRGLEFVNRSLSVHAHNQKGVHLKTFLLRKSGRTQESIAIAKSAIGRDPLDFGARNELIQLGLKEEGKTLASLMHDNYQTYLEIAADYGHAGAYAEAIEFLEHAVEGPEPDSFPNGTASATDSAANSLNKPANLKTSRAAGHVGETGMPNLRPMVFYFLAYYANRKGDRASAAKYFKLAAEQEPIRCFPNSLDSILVLQTVIDEKPADGRASYYLGNLWYDKRQVAEAISCWERATRVEPTFPTPHRNLALAYFNNQAQPERALKSLETAFELDPSDARVLFELDLLSKRLRISPQKRLDFLQLHREAVASREDLLLEYITLLNFFGKHEQALDILISRKFHPWEGGEGKVTGQYVIALVEMAKRLLARKTEIVSAIELLERARSYPENLGEGKLQGAEENLILYWLGVAQDQAGERGAAREYWKEASTGMKEPSPAVYYNDQNPDTIFYQGLALQRLGKPKTAKRRFETLLKFGQRHLRDKVAIDYFAVSLPEFMVFNDDLSQRNRINCLFLMGLGYRGLGKVKLARRELRRVLRLDPSHLPARLQLNALGLHGKL